MDFDELYKMAMSVVGHRDLNVFTDVASVGAAILTVTGNVYLGVNIDTSCSMGFCAEHSAAAAMITAGESEIAKLIAVRGEKIIPPCGRCRQFLSQLNEKNANAEVMVLKDKVVTLAELLPYDWTHEYEI